MITERNMIFANPQAYRVFPQIGNPYNTGITDTAIYEGYLQVTDDSGTTKSFTNTSTIDFTGFKGIIDIDQYTDTGSVKLGRWRITDTIENDIMSSMVLWYDLAKQGATNESMAADPRLIDHSGNGHDATCYNFAWSGMSGIGGYETNFNDRNLWSNVTELDTVKEFRNEGFIFFRAGGDTSPLYTKGYCPDMHIKVTGITNSGARLEFGSGTIEESDASIKLDGEYLIDKVNGRVAGFKLYGDPTATYNIKVELIPLYPNALVSDGVDGYVKVNGLPTADLKRGFTVFYNGALLGVLDGDYYGSVFQKGHGDTNDVEASFYIFRDKYYYNVTEDTTPNGDEYVVIPNTDGINVGTSKKFNGKEILAGSFTATDDSYTIFARPDSNNRIRDYGLSAMRSTLVFDRDLTDVEIEWVKTNLIETKQ